MNAFDPRKRYCMKCRWFRKDHASMLALPDLCLHEEARDPVGYFREASKMRYPGMKCGPDGALYEQKPVELEPTQTVRLPFWKRLFA